MRIVTHYVLLVLDLCEDLLLLPLPSSHSRMCEIFGNDTSEHTQILTFYVSHLWNQYFNRYYQHQNSPFYFVLAYSESTEKTGPQMGSFSADKGLVQGRILRHVVGPSEDCAWKARYATEYTFRNSLLERFFTVICKWKISCYIFVNASCLSFDHLSLS